MTPYYRHVSEAAKVLSSQGSTTSNKRKTLSLWFVPLVVALGVTAVHAQSSQSLPAKVGLSKQECAALGVYRDSTLFRDWDQVQTQLRDVTIRFQGLREAKDVLHTSKSDLEFVTALGTIAYRAKATANLAENLAKLLVPEAKLASTTLDLIEAYNTAKDPLGAARDAVAALHPITQALHTVNTLASDASNTTESKSISAEINAQLSSQMAHLSKNIDALEQSAVALNGQVRNLQDFKSTIDYFCGGLSGCTIPGSTVSNRLGTTKCLVDVAPALCPSCKSGYRHRCEALGEGGLEWRPIEECLPNELKNSKSGAPRQQTAAALFSAQAADLASTPTREQRLADRRRRESDAAGIANAIRRGAAQAEERNQQLRVMEAESMRRAGPFERVQPNELVGWRNVGNQAQPSPPAAASNTKLVTAGAQGSRALSDANNCVYIDRSNSLGDFIGNRCSFSIAVWFCVKDSGHPFQCGGSDGKSVGQLDYVSANSKSSTLKGKHYYWFACGSPDVDAYLLRSGVWWDGQNVRGGCRVQ